MAAKKSSGRSRSSGSTKGKPSGARKPSAAKSSSVPPEAEPASTPPDVTVEPGAEGGVATKAVEAAQEQDDALAASQLAEDELAEQGSDPPPDRPPDRPPEPEPRPELDATGEVPEGMARARVALGTHLYWYEDENGKRRQATATRGSVLTLAKDEIERGLKIEALVPLDDPMTDPAFDPLDLEDAALAKWVSTHTVDQVVELATSIERSNRLLLAERDSHDGDPRVGVLRGIEAVQAAHGRG